MAETMSADRGAKAPQSDAVVVFGVTGDLAQKEIFPALYGLFRDEHVHAGRRGGPFGLDHRATARAGAGDALARGGKDDEALAELVRQLHYVRGDYGSTETYGKIHEALPGAEPALLHGHTAQCLSRGPERPGRIWL